LFQSKLDSRVLIIPLRIVSGSVIEVAKDADLESVKYDAGQEDSNPDPDVDPDTPPRYASPMIKFAFPLHFVILTYNRFKLQNSKATYVGYKNLFLG